MESKRHLDTISFLIYNLILIFIIFFLTGNICFAQFEPFKQITDDNYEQTFPSIDGDNIVYEDDRTGGDPDIYFYNLNTDQEYVVNSDPAYSSSKPDISGNRIVWQDNRNGNWDLYMYDINNPGNGAVELIIWEGDQVEPAIWGDILVFSDKKPANASYNIYMFDFSTGVLTRLTNSEDGDQRHPDVYDQTIVWQDYRNGNWDIYMYQIVTDEITPLTDDPHMQIHPSIHDRRVVWEDYRDGNANLYMHHTTFGLGNVYDNFDWPVFTGPFGYHNLYNQINPVIYGDYIVFQDNRNGNFDLFLYSFFNDIAGNTTSLIEEINDQKYPAISGDRVVWHDDRKGVGKADIWMWTHPPGADLAVLKIDDPDPVPIGSEFTYQIYVRNFGPEDATGVVLTDYLPSEVNYVSAEVSKNCTWSRVGNEITFDLNTIQNGTTDTITIVVQTTVGGILTNTASVTANEDDEMTENNQISIKTEVKWQIPTEIGEGENPCIAVDPDGYIHIGYYIADMGGFELCYANNKTGNWQKEVILIDDFINSIDIDVDNNGKVHMAYGQMNNLKYINDTLGSWSSPAILGNKMEESRSVSLEMDSNDKVHICYLYSMWNDGDLMYITNKSGTWTTTTLYDSTYNSMSMSMDQLDHLHIAFYSFHNQWGITYMTNSPDGNWGSPGPVEVAWNGGQMETLITDIDVDNNNNPHVSYVGNSLDFNEDTKYAYKPNGDWEYSKVDEGDFAGSISAITVDINNKPHMIYYHRQSEEIRYARNLSGASWEIVPVEFELWEDGMDMLSDQSGYIHIVYMKEGKVYYVTDRPQTPQAEVPEIQVTPNELDFVFRNVGDTTEAKQAVVKNIGEADLVIDDIRIVWQDSLNFSIVDHTCSVLEPDSSCVVDIVFNPQSIGDKHALLWIESNDPANPEEGVSLKGTGLTPIIWDKGDPHFGEVNVHDTLTHEYIIENRGNSNLVIDLVTIDGPDAGQFFFDGLPETPFSVDEGDSIVFNLSFAPVSGGFKEATLRIFSNDLDLVRPVDGTGVAVPEITITPQALDFTATLVGDMSEVEQAVIKNEGEADLIIGDIQILQSDSVHFSITGHDCTELKPDSICIIDLVFNPQSMGDKNAMLSIKSNDPDHPEIEISLTGLGLAPGIWEKGKVNFNEVNVNDTLRYEYLIGNEGNTALELGQVIIEGDHADQFYIDGLPDFPITIEEGDSLTYHVSFIPASIGLKNADLKIFSNDRNMVIPIEGTGILKPVIISFDPGSGPVDTEVTIHGLNFSDDPQDNTVFIGEVKTEVISGTTTSLSVQIPYGAYYGPVRVINEYGRMACSGESFIVTYPGSNLDENSFTIPVNLNTGNTPLYAATGDMNGDHLPDIVASTFDDDQFSVFINTNNRQGIISFADAITFSTGDGPQIPALGDLNGDGKLDVAISNITNNRVTVYQNMSTGGNLDLELVDHLPSNFSPIGIAIQDLDQDGRQEIIIVNLESHNISIYRNISNKDSIMFENKIDVDAGLEPRGLVVGDFDGDSYFDIAITNYSENSVSVMKNTSKGAEITFGNRTIYELGLFPMSIMDLDMNLDGRQDLVVYCADSLFVLLNESQPGDLQFDDPLAIQKSTYTSNRAEVGFLNGDEYPDLILPGVNKFVLFQKETPGTMSFSDGSDFENIDNPFTFSIADLDFNGRPDIVAVNRDDNSLSVFRNTVTKANITGSILEPDGTPVTEGDVFIIKLNEDGLYSGMYFRSLEGSSSYTLVEIPKTDVVVKFIPDNELYPGYLTTYHQNAYFFEEANILELKTDETNIDVTLFTAPPPPDGNTEISGSISEENADGRIAEGMEVLEGISLFLIDKSNHTLIDYAVSDNEGNFMFENIPPGTYGVKVDYSGYSMDPECEDINIESVTQKVTLAVTVDKPYIDVRVLKVTGLQQASPDQLITLYPNPCDQLVNVHLNYVPDGKVRMWLYNAHGKLIRDFETGRYDNHFTVQMDQYPEGAYIILLQLGDRLVKEVLIKN